jgi:hypothetical protein
MFATAKKMTAVLLGLAVLTASAHDAFAFDLKLNGKVVDAARSQIGQQVGDGQCWALADWALAQAGAHRPGRDGYGTYVFGEQAMVWTPSDQKNSSKLRYIHPGTLIQFEGVKFQYPNGTWYEFEHHTAIVLTNFTQHSSKIEVLQQNVNGVKKVSTMTLDLLHMTKGTMTFYQPVTR